MQFSLLGDEEFIHTYLHCAVRKLFFLHVVYFSTSSEGKWRPAGAGGGLFAANASAGARHVRIEPLPRWHPCRFAQRRANTGHCTRK